MSVAKCLRGWVCCGIGLALASATLAAGEDPQERTYELRPPAKNEVVVTVVCPPADEANGRSFQVIVHPPLKEVDREEPVVWTRDTHGDDGHGEFSIRPCDQSTWPWVNETTDETPNTITGTLKQGAQDGTYKYSITVVCNGERVTFDPRMRLN